MESFSEKMIEWYEENGRDLPWRATKDPYLIWISEIILQQTRVAQGYDYYQRFIERFPDIFALAEADEDEVMKYWQGLGYYSRARNLHTAARDMIDSGGFPITYEGVRALKGVGEYTAAAICSFAYGMPYAVVDGNVYRVLSRWLGISIPIDSTKGKRIFARVADELLDRQRPGLYNQAIMDFGALLCTPVSPDCVSCPLGDSCVAHLKRLVGSLPVKCHKAKVTNRYFNYIYVRMGAYTYIHKRSGNDIWKNLYELPLIETEREWTEEEFYASSQFRGMLANGEEPVVRLVRKGVKHVLSHRVIYANFYEVILPDDSTSFANYQKISLDDLHKFAVSRLVNQFFSLILEPNN
ncbi:A/G-specific adenine glycosylase [Phocaeicola sp.]|uniref:A/G-specific adenine glycosylase n=1 Tax=Phocaeicola sp. TaxID=2773926 RepID=UPI0023C9F27F|nr:A/G-specific adenine glycosylase [Phocaeicola sp.]MDE5676911.1 A/G-specific adenine glycosylase [Phocaeicola sp.]